MYRRFACVCVCVCREMQAGARYAIHFLHHPQKLTGVNFPPFSPSCINFLLWHSSARLHTAHLLWLHYHKLFYNICLSIIIVQIPVPSDLCSEWTPGVRHCLANEKLSVSTLSSHQRTQPLQLEPGALLNISRKLRNRALIENTVFKERVAVSKWWSIFDLISRRIR